MIASQLGNSQNLVAIKAIRERTLVLKDGSLRQVLMVGGTNFSLRSENEQDILIGAFQAFLNGLDFPIQIVVHSRKINIQRYLDDLAARKEKEASPLLQNQIEEYKEFVRQFVQENAIMEKSFFVVVPWYPVAIAKKTSGIFSSLPFVGKKKNKSSEKEAADPAEENLSEEIHSLNQRVAQVMDGLVAMDLGAVALNDEQLVELFYNLYNPGTVEVEDIDIKDNS